MNSKIHLMPLVSIVTVVYNAQTYLEQCMLSVIQQTYPNIEYILVDGGSTDGSLELIKKYSDRINNWISESDSGIGDAMNKGIAMSTGQYIVFLHADDYFNGTLALEKTVSQIQDDSEIVMADILFGDKFEHRKSRGLDFLTNFKTGVNHQGALCKKTLFDRLGCFDVNLSIAMDYDFFLRAYLNQASFEFTDTVLSVMRDTGVSSQTDWETLSRRFKEEKHIHYKNCGPVAKKALYYAYWVLYWPYRKIKSHL